MSEVVSSGAGRVTSKKPGAAKSVIISPAKAQKRERRVNIIWMTVIFLLITAAEIFAAYKIVYEGGFTMTDALSRTANAYYVSYLNPTKLASIGFVWNPLPSLLQIPIVYFAKYWQPLASSGFAGCIITSLFAGINAALIFRYFRQAGLKIGVALIIVILFALNPFIFLYGLNGMSETLFFTSMIMCVANFAFWIGDRKTGRLVIVGLMLAIGFLIRYEVFALMLAFGIAMLIVVYWMPDKESPFLNKPIKMKWDYSVATATMLFLPVLYAIGMWMFINWSIMGDPLHFLHSAYSNESQSAFLSNDFKQQIQGLIPSLRYVLPRMFPFLIPFFALVGIRIYTKRLIKQDFLILAVLIGAISGFHLVMLMAQKSYGWLRFYSFALIITIAWFPYEITQLKKGVKIAAIILLCVSLALSGIVLINYFSDEDIMKEEAMYVGENTRGNSQVQMAELINQKYSDSVLLFDSFTTAGVITNLKNPGNVLTSIADELFEISVADPPQSSADYIIVPTVYTPEGTVGGVGLLDYINRQFPSLYARGASWAELVYGNEGYRLYKIIRWHQEDVEVADYLTQNTESGSVYLFDIATTGILKEKLGHPRNAITNMSKDYSAAIQDPKAYGVNYIVFTTPNANKANGVDDLATQYPDFMTQGVPFGKLIFENSEHQVFEVIYD